MLNKALVWFFWFAFICQSDGELVPKSSISYASKPGQKYTGPMENVVVSDLGDDVSGTLAEQVCSNDCSLSALCGAFYVQGSTCHKVPVSNKLKTTTTSMNLQPPNYFVKESTVDTPLRASSTTTTTLRSDNITTTTAAATITTPPPPPIDAACAAVTLQVHSGCLEHLAPTNGAPGIGNGCQIKLAFKAAGDVNWRLGIEATSDGVPSRIGEWKVFDTNGEELTELKALRGGMKTVLKWDDVQKTDLNVWLHLYGTEANPTNLVVTNLQWGKYADRPNMITCGEGITTTAATTTPPPPPLDAACAAVTLQVHSACLEHLAPTDGTPGIGNGCQIKLALNAAGDVNWRLGIEATSNGIPSRIGEWKVFDSNGEELTELKAMRGGMKTVLKWDDVQKTDLNVWLHLYGTEADPTNIMVTNLQWGKYGDADKVICGPS